MTTHGIERKKRAYKARRVTAALLAVLAAIMFLPSAVSCGAKAKDGISVVTTLFPQYDFARQVMGNADNIELIIGPGQEAHTFSPSVGDIAKIRNADLLVYVGGETDGWVEDALKTVGRQDMKVLSLLELCGTLTEEHVEGMETEEEENHGEDGGEAEYDEHVWTSPANAKLITEAVRDALCALDPDNAEKYRANCADYTVKLDALDAELTELAGSAKRKTIVFAERFPFRYLCERYGLSYYAAFPGCSSQSEPSLATLSFLCGKVKEYNIPVILTIEFSTGVVADWIAEQTGARVLELHSCHNVTKKDFDSGVTYLLLMEKNVSVLREALG